MYAFKKRSWVFLFLVLYSSQGVQAASFDGWYQGSLYEGIKQNDQEMVKKVLEGGYLGKADPDGMNRKGAPLTTAMSLGHLQIAKVLLEEGADPSLSWPAVPNPTPHLM